MGPGSMRVAKWIGRLGVVGLPAVAVGLQLEERVVRRHVAKLERAGWLRRDSWIRGQGSILWLTKPGSTEALGSERLKWPVLLVCVRLGVVAGARKGRVRRLSASADAVGGDLRSGDRAWSGRRAAGCPRR
jgi:hypothetical protein